MTGPEDMARTLVEAGWTGWGGECWAFAAALLERAGPGHAVVLAVNAAVLERGGGLVGHAALELPRGSFLDGDLEPKEWEDIESWGMLDPHDSDWTPFFRDEGDAETVRALRFPDAQSLLSFLGDVVDPEEISAMREALGAGGPSPAP